jgi:CRP/FNR family transcriptional regulator, cyclic AMP receptor protein
MERVPQPSCFDCSLRPDRTFCDLPAGALQAFDAIKVAALYPRGTVLFEQARMPRSVFLLCDGRAKLFLCSETGRRLTLGIAGPGEILGLSAALAGSPYELNAELMDNSQVAVIKRKDMLQFLRQHREACMQVVHVLSSDLHTAYDRVRAVGLTRTRRPRIPATPAVH